jgi:curli biogenesis system outer membrane secretion channel CsgG
MKLSLRLVVLGLLACLFSPATAQNRQGATAPARQAAPAQPRLPVVALRRLEDFANTGQGPAFSRMLQTAIVSTAKFRVMDRSFASALMEQRDAASGLVTTNRPGRSGGFEGADFLIEATITTASAGRRADLGSTFVANLIGGRNSNVRCSRMAASIAVDIQILDAATNEARYASRINQTGQSAASCTGDDNVDVAAMLRLAADRIAASLVTTIYPIQIMALQPDGSILLNYGEGTLTAGAIMSVYGPSTAVPDPGTGRMIMVDGMRLGDIRVTEVQARFSRAVATGPMSAPLAVGAIVRPAQASASNGNNRRRGRQ